MGFPLKEVRFLKSMGKMDGINRMSDDVAGAFSL